MLIAKAVKGIGSHDIARGALQAQNLSLLLSGAGGRRAPLYAGGQERNRSGYHLRR